ncbi:hypothetical protein HYV87_02130 [Candidatus Woesearchaeota archaeon]|nr:hypothetical protein [Candidatus Woesearchaeota archaeon]
MAKAPDLSPASGFDNAKLYVWIKGLESKVNNLLREVDVLKNDFITRANKLNRDFKTLNDDLVELGHQQQKMDQKMVLIIKELKQTAGAEEVMTLKKYVEFWNPLTFVTQRDLERAVESKLELSKMSATQAAEKSAVKKI